MLFLCVLLGARFTFAVKMAPSKEIALQKSLDLDIDPLLEALEDAEENEAVKIKKILHDIRTGKMNAEEIEEVVSKYEHMSSKRESLIHT